MKEKIIILFTLFVMFSTNIFADEEVSYLAKELNLYAGTKASIQWERIFSSERRLKRYKLDKLDEKKLLKLRNYLIRHAADSKQPIVPGL